MDTDPQDGESFQTFSIEKDPDPGEPTIYISISFIRFYTIEVCYALTTGSWAGRYRIGNARLRLQLGIPTLLPLP